MSYHKEMTLHDFPETREMLEEAKGQIAQAIEREMREQGIRRPELAKRLQTSRSALHRLLNPKDPSVTLHTLARVASALGKRVTFQLR